MLIRNLEKLQNILERKKTPSKKQEGKSDFQIKIAREFFKDLSSNNNLNYIPPPDSLKADHLQKSIFPHSLSSKVNDFDKTYLSWIIEETFKDPKNQEIIENFKLNASQKSLELEFNDNITMIPLAKDQRRDNLKFNLYNNSEIKLKSISISKNPDKEFFTIEIPYSAKSKHQSFNDKYIVNIESGVPVEDSSHLENLIELNSSVKNLEKIKTLILKS